MDEDEDYTDDGCNICNTPHGCICDEVFDSWHDNR
jgi:hypothetical protein